MFNTSPLYRLYAPEHNPNLLNQIVEKIAKEDWFPTRAIIVGVSVEAPMMITQNEGAKFGGMEHFQGFRAAITLMNSSIYMASDDPMSQMMANNSLMQSMNSEVMDLGQRFLDTGRTLLLRDLSGKRLMAEIIKQLKSNFPNQDFQRGAKTAEDIFLAYWKILERLGFDLIDPRAS